ELDQVHRAARVNEGELEMTPLVAPATGSADRSHVRLAEIAADNDEIAARRGRRGFTSAGGVVEIDLGNVGPTIGGKVGAVSKIGTPNVTVIPTREQLHSGQIVPESKVAPRSRTIGQVRTDTALGLVAPHTASRIPQRHGHPLGSWSGPSGGG